MLLIVGFIVGFEIEDLGLGLLAVRGLSAAFGSSLMWIFILLGLTMKTAQAVQGMASWCCSRSSSVVDLRPAATMPGWLQTFTDYNPLSTLADAARGLIGGRPVAHALWVTIGWSVAITAVMAPVAIHKFRTKS